MPCYGIAVITLCFKTGGKPRLDIRDLSHVNEWPRGCAHVSQNKIHYDQLIIHTWCSTFKRYTNIEIVVKLSACLQKGWPDVKFKRTLNICFNLSISIRLNCNGLAARFFNPCRKLSSSWIVDWLKSKQYCWFHSIRDQWFMFVPNWLIKKHTEMGTHKTMYTYFGVVFRARYQTFDKIYLLFRKHYMIALEGSSRCIASIT